MNKKKQLTISEFARLTGIKRDNLRFYDRIGLLSPKERGDNKYRYYSRHQLNTAYLISGLRGFGVSIEDIKRHKSLRSPKESLVLLAQQDERIQNEIERLKEMKSVMKQYTEMMEEALAHEEKPIFFLEKKRESIFLCPSIPADMDEDEASVFSYDDAEAHGVHLGYPVGILVEEKNIEQYIQNGVGQHYFKTHKHCNAYKEEGLYAVAYGCQAFEEYQALYDQLLTFVKNQGFHICGDIYEEYPLNDISLDAKEHYGIRLEVRVEKNKNIE